MRGLASSGRRNALPPPFGPRTILPSRMELKPAPPRNENRRRGDGPKQNAAIPSREPLFLENRHNPLQALRLSHLAAACDG